VTADSPERRQIISSTDNFVVSRRQVWVARTVTAVLIGIGAIGTLVAPIQLSDFPGYMGMLTATTFIIYLLVAVLLFCKGHIEQRGAPIHLGAAYLFVCLTFITLPASFPAGWADAQLIGGPSSAAWIYILWHFGFGLAIIRFAWLAARDPPPPASLPRAIACVVVAALVCMLIATAGEPFLPKLVGHHGDVSSYTSSYEVAETVALVVTVAALIALARLPQGSGARVWISAAMVANGLDLWLSMLRAGRFTLVWYLARIGTLLPAVLLLIVLLYEIVQLQNQAAAATRVLSPLARTDGLTGLANRRTFDETLESEWRRALRTQQVLSLLMIDLDHFKAFNDRYGHQRGDACLQLVAAALQAQTRRPGDLAARYGGEEFVLLLPAADPQKALLMADLVQTSIRALMLRHEASEAGFVTVSIGAASAVPEAGSHPADLLRCADQRLYQAKAAGRDRVIGEARGEKVLSGTSRG
jgi:diguanylate cyclase (GGDEF)-like protein